MLLFLLYSAFCVWVVFLNGADFLQRHKSLFILNWFAAALTTDELRFYVGVSWIACFVIFLFNRLGGA